MSFSFASYCFDKYKKFLTHNYKGYSFISIDRIRSEWKWHNLAYVYNFERLPTRSVDVFFDSDDINHGIFSWIINNLRWW